MKAMILAAGRGERMRPLTDTCPKPLLEVGGHKLIEYHIRALVKSGIHHIVINHAYLGNLIEEYLGDGRRYDADIVYSAESEALETGGGIFKALDLLGDEAFVLVNGDVWTDFGFNCLPKKISSLAHLIVVANPAHNPEGDFSLVNGLLHPAGENKLTSRLTYSGIGVYHPDLFSGCRAGRFPLAPLLKNAMKKNKISGESFTGQWVDIGTPERLEKLDNKLKGKNEF